MVQVYASLCLPNREIEYVTLEDVNLSETGKYLKEEIVKKVNYLKDEIGEF